MKTARDTQRADRRRHGVPSVAIAGYTNAGKSSLLNRITGAGVLVDDTLFATLDPTVRRAQTPGGRDFTVADTVGFVRHLPHQLVEAFRSTLEEVTDADLILHVVDGSDDAPEEQITAVRTVLAEIGAQHVPEIIVVNKADAADPVVLNRMLRREPHSIVVSARTGEGIAELLALIEAELPHARIAIDLVVPYSRGDLVARAHREGELELVEHLESGHPPRGPGQRAARRRPAERERPHRLSAVPPRSCPARLSFPGRPRPPETTVRWATAGVGEQDPGRAPARDVERAGTVVRPPVEVRRGRSRRPRGSGSGAPGA